MTEHVTPPVPDDDLVHADDAIIGHAFRWSLIVGVVLAVVIVGVVLLVRDRDAGETVIIDRGPIEPPQTLPSGAAAMPDVTLTEITTGAGIDFVHTSGANGEKLLPETMGGGCAFFDADGDGDQDLLLVNGHVWSHDRGVVYGGTLGRLNGEDSELPAAIPGDTLEPLTTSALYRNDGTGQFENVTAGSGLDVPLYGMGVAVGDYDNDGDQDVYLTAVGANHLFRNDGSGHFEMVVPNPVAGDTGAWSTSAGFFDYDNDGDLDLFVCNYVTWSREIDLRLGFTLNGTDRAYGPPKQYGGAHPVLYRNDGDGVFTDVSKSAGIEVANPATGQPVGKALAVTFADVDGDGFIDVFVANDTVQNFVYRSFGDGTFEEMGHLSGVAFDTTGMATGAMGMDAADYANDGSLGVGIANFANENTSLYVQQPRDPWQFAEMSGTVGIGSPSRLNLSFGLFFFDYDLDGRLDLLQANGHLEDEINEIQPSQHYRQPAQLFWNAGPDARTCFVVVPETGDLARPIVGRGASFADIDGDGDLDVVLTQTGGPPLLIRNDQDLGHHWVRFLLEGGDGVNRDAIGAWVEVEAGGLVQRRQVMPTRSYLSQVERAVTFGLGAVDRVDRVTITWPDGTREDLPTPPAVDAVHTIRRSGV